MSDINATRIANFTKFAANLRAFADRQEARALGQMDHVTGPAIRCAELAEQAADAYRRGDKEAASEARSTYAAELAKARLEQIAG